MKFFPVALAGLMLGACSSEDVVDDGSTHVKPGEDGYISLKINLPQRQSTRANDEFDDGLASEYVVHDATLILFGGSSEADATLQSAYGLSTVGFGNEGTSTDQITSTATITQKITKPAGDNLYALVVLNNNGLVTATESSVKFASAEMKGKTFSEFAKAVATVDADDLSGKGFFMTNAPLYSKAGGTVDPVGGKLQTLAPIDETKVFDTETEAGNAPAASIYVERALAKVTVTAGAVGNDFGNENIASAVINGWVLDNTNTSTYYVRNFDGSWVSLNNADATEDAYRFVGSSLVNGDNDSPLYRTYFGKDPNFDADAQLSTIGGGVPAVLNAVGTDKPAYCLENTFDVDRMKDENTTRVIVAATLTRTGSNSAEDFYILNHNTATLYDKDGVVKEVKRLYLTYFESVKQQFIKNGTIGENDLTVTFSGDGNGGYIDVSALTFGDLDGVVFQDGKTKTDLQANATAYITNINKSLTIGYYKGGVSYYPVKIKHFGDASTPWNVTGTESYPGTPDERTGKWLGRWGVLRNNWYEINVKSLKNIGEPEVPEVTTSWDDPLDSYISVEINVLSWTKRSQDADL